MVITLTNNQGWEVDDRLEETIEELEAFQMLISNLRAMPEYTVVFRDFTATLSIYIGDRKIPKALLFMIRPYDNVVAFRITPYGATGNQRSDFVRKMEELGYKVTRNFTINENELVFPLYDAEKLRDFITHLYKEIVEPTSNSIFS